MAEAHPFEGRPHRMLIALALPVMVSLIAEPITGLVDTAFVARLGGPPLAALGIGTAVLSSVLWIFNFLGVGTQTEVARDAGEGSGRGVDVLAVALALALLLGIGLGLVALPLLPGIVEWMGADPLVAADALAYLRLRLLGGPAVLLTMACFGALRGLQDMTTPLRIAVGLNALNIALDAVLVLGAGPIPGLGVAGAALATVLAQWVGALWALVAALSRLGRPTRIPWAQAPALLRVGRDMVVRTSLLLGFLLLATRAANLAGTADGAAHQAIRQVWLTSALVLDAFAAAAQSLVAWFVGAGRPAAARHVARVASAWGLGTGLLLALCLLLAQPLVALALVPAMAQPAFATAWWLMALSQPINALSFVTDGVHWGTGDFRWLRNGMIVATALGGLGLVALAPLDLAGIWAVTAGWIAVRAGAGLIRVWPGVGAAPLRA